MCSLCCVICFLLLLPSVVVIHSPLPPPSSERNQLHCRGEKRSVVHTFVDNNVHPGDRDQWQWWHLGREGYNYETIHCDGTLSRIKHKTRGQEPIGLPSTRAFLDTFSGPPSDNDGSFSPLLPSLPRPCVCWPPPALSYSDRVRRFCSLCVCGVWGSSHAQRGDAEPLPGVHRIAVSQLYVYYSRARISGLCVAIYVFLPINQAFPV